MKHPFLFVSIEFEAIVFVSISIGEICERPSINVHISEEKRKMALNDKCNKNTFAGHFHSFL